MRELPKGWVWGTFQDLATIEGGYAFRTKDFIKSGPNTAPLVRIGDLAQGRLSLDGNNPHIDLKNAPTHSHLRPGDFLIGLSGSLQNYAWVQEEDLPALLNQRVGRLKCKGSNPRFMGYFYQSPIMQAAIHALARGASQKNLSPRALHQWPTPIPPPAHQAYMAHRLQICDGLIDTGRDLQTQIDRTRQALVESHLNGLIDYAIHPLSTLVAKPLSGHALRAKGDLPLIKMHNIRQHRMHFEKLAHLKAEHCPPEHALRLRVDDILINTRNSPDLVGKSALWTGQMGAATFDNNLLVLRLNGPGMIPHYLQLQLAYGPLRHRMHNLAAGSTTVAALYWRDLRKLKVKCPPLSQQRALLSRIDALDTWYKAEAESQIHLRSIRQNLLARILEPLPG